MREQILLDLDEGNLSAKRVDTWLVLILPIRRQAEQVSEYFSYAQLCLLLQSIVLGTVAVFIVLVGGYGALAQIKEN